MARWEELLDIQLDIHDWMTGPNGRLFGEGYFESAFLNPSDGEGAEWKDVEDARQHGRDWAYALGVNAFNAEPIWVDPDMMTVVEAAVAGFKPEPLIETDLITPNGFLVLPRSMWVTDPHGKHLSWKAAVWFPVAQGIHLALFHDNHDRDDMDMAEEDMARLGKRFTTRWVPTHVANWHWGQNHPGARPDDAPAEWLERDAERSQTVHKQAQGMWRLLTQHIMAVNVRQRPPRAYAKRAAKRNVPSTMVTIVKLRRPAVKGDKGEPQVVNWTHRWLVGGHWRNQWYSTLQTHRQIWISPFVKGPADMPLVVNKARVFEFVQ